MELRLKDSVLFGMVRSMNKSCVETLIGVAIICVTGFCVLYGLTFYKPNQDSGYVVVASFNSVDGISKGSDVSISGVMVGHVTKVFLDSETFAAQVEMMIYNNIKLPKDTRASVSSSGLIGSRFIALEPGRSDEFLQDGSKIIYTQSAINIEGLINKFIYMFSNK